MKKDRKKSATSASAPQSEVVGTTGDGEKIISIPLCERHWVVLLAAIDQMNTRSQRQIGELRDKGITDLASIRSLPQELVTALAAPMLIRGILVKGLTAQGVTTPEADRLVGLDTVMDLVARAQGGSTK